MIIAIWGCREGLFTATAWLSSKLEAWNSLCHSYKVATRRRQVRRSVLSIRIQFASACRVCRRTHCLLQPP